jgi:hypothetical protein
VSPEAQRIAIAEVCGWKEVAQPEDKFGKFFTRLVDGNGRTHGSRTTGEDMKSLWLYCIPNYLTDLNAMHEAEKTLTARQRTLFEVEVLKTVTGRETFVYDKGDLIAVITATAAQRAEAFLRTLSLWTPTK